jgi:RNA polymerase sigma-70 factor (ECF subfamily)
MIDRGESEADGSGGADGRARMGRDLVVLLPRLRRFASGLAGSVQEGDDIVQAACLRALERYRQWQPGTQLDRWMFRIARNIWLDRRKSAWSQKVRSDPELLSAVADRSFERELEARDELARARAAIAALPASQREALLLVSVEGLTYEAAADLLGIPLGTVMSRVARGRVAVARFVRGERESDRGAGAKASA